MSNKGSLKGKRVALIGCGDIGCRLARQLMEEGADVTACRRSIDQLPAGVTACQLDITDKNSLSVLKERAFDYIVITLSPNQMTDESYKTTYVDGLKNILSVLDTRHLAKLFWVSSTSVYGQSDGSWVDENSETIPTRYSGKRQLEAEQLLQAINDKSCIVRFSGIYREGRHRLVEKIKAGEIGSKVDNDYYTNRIHVVDCVAVLKHLILRDASGDKIVQLYLASDSMPVKYSELIQWLSKTIGQSLNDKAKTQTPRVGSKRCSNKRLLDSGYQFIYPGYREGFLNIIHCDL